jgi:hypothetical protein
MDYDMTYNQKGDNVIPITLTCSWGGGTIDDFLEPPSTAVKEKAPVVFMVFQPNQIKQKFIRSGRPSINHSNTPSFLHSFFAKKKGDKLWSWWSRCPAEICA